MKHGPHLPLVYLNSLWTLHTLLILIDGCRNQQEILFQIVLMTKVCTWVKFSRDGWHVYSLDQLYNSGRY